MSKTSAAISKVAGTYIGMMFLINGVVLGATEFSEPIPSDVTTIAIATEAAAIKIKVGNEATLGVKLTSANAIALPGNANVVAKIEGEVLTIKAHDTIAEGFSIRQFLATAPEPVLTVILPAAHQNLGLIVTSRSGSVEVPEPLSVGSFVVTTSSGEVALSCISASDAVRIASDSGDIRADQCLRSRVTEISSESGDLAARGAEGAVTASTESGDIALEVEGSAQTKSESGDINLTLVPTETAPGETKGASESGNIKIRIPTKADVTFEISSESGSLSSGENRSDGGRVTHGVPTAKHKITLGTTSGDIDVTRM